MAERRMFAKTIIDSDAFLDMPLSAQALYFHLSMRADDDGFLNNAKKIMKIINANQNDYDLLVLKSFIIQFDDGICVIKHWRINNYLRNDRYKPTIYQEQKDMLTVKDNGRYSLKKANNNIGIPDRYQCETQDSIDKDSIDKDRLGKDSIGYINSSNTNVLDCPTESDKSEGKFVYEKETTLWNELKTLGIAPIRGIVAQSKRASLLKARLKQYGSDSFAEIIEAIKESDFLQGKHQGKPWQITFDWVILPSNYPKVLEGNYKNKKTTTRSQFDDFDIEGL